MRQYLLGILAKQGHDQLEESYFSDVEGFEELVAAENDRVDAYVRDELPESERELFEKAYSNSPERRAKIAFARALNRISFEDTKTARVPEKQPLWQSVGRLFSSPRTSLQWGFVLTAAAAIIFGSLWLIIQNGRLRSELNQAHAAEDEFRKNDESVRQQIATIHPQQTRETPEKEQTVEVAQLDTQEFPELVLRLVPGTVRGVGSGNVLRLPLVKSRIRLEMEPAEQYSSYQVVLQTAEGQNVYRSSTPRGSLSNKLIVLTFPSNMLHQGDYILRLNGRSADATEEVEAYFFSVVQR